MEIDEAIVILESERRRCERNAAFIDETTYQPGQEVDATQFRILADALSLATLVLSDTPRVAPARRGDPSTSQEAADLVRPKKAHEALLRAMRSADGEAWTGKRMAEAAGITGQASWWKRVSEIKQAGHIAPVGTERSPDTGRKVETYRLTEKGRRV